MLLLDHSTAAILVPCKAKRVVSFCHVPFGIGRAGGWWAFLFVHLHGKTFFGKATCNWSFDTSGICCKTTTENFLLFATLSCLLADEKALVQLWCTKGASSYKPCHLCKNVMGRNAAPPGHSYLVPYTCADAALFDLHSAESFQNMACMLKIAASEEHPKRFDKLEKAYGLVFHPLGLPWCQEIQTYATPLQTTAGIGCISSWQVGVWRNMNSTSTPGGFAKQRA